MDLEQLSQQGQLSRELELGARSRMRTELSSGN